VTFEDTSTGYGGPRRWRFGDGAESASRTVQHGWSSPGFYEVTLSVSDGEREVTMSRTFLVEAQHPAGTCEADDSTRCLQDSRYAVQVDWWASENARGAGRVVRAGTNDSALFYFFEPGDNWEMLVKVLDGCRLNDRMWVYAASATTLGYRIEVRDTATGAVKEYVKEPGSPAPAITDAGAFPGGCAGGGSSAASGSAWSGGVESVVGFVESAFADVASEGRRAVAVGASNDGGCTETETMLCLQRGRYEVSARWSTLTDAEGVARTARPRTPDSGLFHFFDPGNWEVLVKVLDGCGYNDRHWVFAASATDVGFELTVRDTSTGAVRQYVKEAGKPAPAVADLGAFPDGCRPAAATAQGTSE
jgi:hypothetical protein